MVIAGDKLGKKLGFPTANLDVTGLVLPPNGVYAAVTRHEGRLYRVALNIGIRPTVATGRQLRVEAHLLDFDGDLYGRTIDVAFIGWIRHEQKFDSIEVLKRHMTSDAAQARDALRRAGNAFPLLGDI